MTIFKKNKEICSYDETLLRFCNICYICNSYCELVLEYRYPTPLTELHLKKLFCKNDRNCSLYCLNDCDGLCLLIRGRGEKKKVSIVYYL